ncbi:MAG: site-specific DNA-methyltransferase [Sulfuricurvum sp.]
MSYGSLSNDELIEIIKKQNEELKRKKYGLVWESEREPEKVVLDCAHYLPVLKSVNAKTLTTDESEDNILIEGDNYHALSVLSYTHKEKIDVIYIDPPYNTGNKDFVYNDRFVEKEDKYRHSKWLNFMEKRLNLAKDLLTKDGVIFASIDDNEYPRLIMLFEKIFGENNIKTVVVKMSEASGLKMGGALRNGSIPKLKEYIIIAKIDGINNIFFDQIPKERWDNEYNIFLENFSEQDKEKIELISEKVILEDYDIEELDNLVQKIELISLTKKIKELKISKKEQENWLFANSYRIIRTAASESVHRLALEKKKMNNNQLFFVRSKTGLLYFVKSDFLESSSKPRVQIIFAKDNLTQHPGDFWSDIKTTGLDNEGGVDFKNGKKPIKLIERLIKSVNKENLTVLDFFAGSGTTGEVVLKLGSIKNIKFILCTTNDENEHICDNATYPRLQNAISQYGGNLRYFKTSLLKKSKSIKSLKSQLTRECMEMLCLKENIFNLKKETKEYKIFASNDEGKYLCVYFDTAKKGFETFVSELKAIDAPKAVYVFSNSTEINQKNFIGVKDFSVEAIPQKILAVYKRLVKLNISSNPEMLYLDFEKAKKRIFEEKDKDDGARLLRVILEKTIEKIASSNGINITDFSELSRLNDHLKQKEIFTKVLWEENKTYIAIGNHAAHGDHEDYDQKQVENFYRHIHHLIETFIG